MGSFRPFSVLGFYSEMSGSRVLSRALPRLDLSAAVWGIGCRGNKGSHQETKEEAVTEIQVRAGGGLDWVVVTVMRRGCIPHIC